MSDGPGPNGPLIVLDSTTERTLITEGAAIGAFVVIAVGTALRVRGDIAQSRALVVAARVALVPLLVSFVVQLYYDAAFAQRVVAPSFGVARPLAGILVTLLCASIDSHPAFRWAALISMPTLVVLDACTAAMLRWQLDCRAAGLCVQNPVGGYSTAALEVLEPRAFVAIALEARVHAE